MKHSIFIPLVVLIFLGHRVVSQNMVVGNDLPCGVDNLSCVNATAQGGQDNCLTVDQLCDGTADCADGLDEGNQFASLDCK